MPTMEEKKSSVNSKNKLNDLTGKEWIQETKSFFFQKGLGSNHPETKYEKLHPAPFSYLDVARLIKFFTKKGDRVLDPFLGVGSTIKACLDTDREGYGIELSEKWCEITKKRLKEESNFIIDEKHLICGDSREIKKYFPNNYFDFIITSPPYWNILKKIDRKTKERVENGLDVVYSESDKDLGNIEDYHTFLKELTKIFFKCYDVLKNEKYMCIIVSDFNHKSELIPFHAHLIEKLTNKRRKKRFLLKGIKILLQNAKRLFPYGYPYSYVENIHHQYIIILQKKEDKT